MNFNGFDCFPPIKCLPEEEGVEIEEIFIENLI